MSKIIFVIFKKCLNIVSQKRNKCFKNEIVLVTGAGHGLGKALAKRFAAMEAKVVLWDKNKKTVHEVASEIQNAGGCAYAYSCDVTNEDEVLSTARQVSEKMGDVSVLVNNAGILQNRPFGELSSSEVRKTFEVNVLSHFWTIRAFLPKMLEKNSGQLVAISSMAGLIGQVNQTDYSASKFAIVGLMESLSEEIRLLGKKITTTTICPLAINTGLISNLSTRQPYWTPILSIDEAADEVMDAIKKEKYITTVPSYLYNLFIFNRFFPREVAHAFSDFAEYCRIPNNKCQLLSTNEKIQKAEFRRRKQPLSI